MTVLHRLILFSGVIFLASAVQAQQVPEGKRVFGTMTERDDPNSKTIKLESEMTTRITLPGTQIIPCQARVTLSYYQSNTLAHVQSNIEYSSCLHSRGSFEISATTRADEGERQSLVFPESWEMHDTDELEFSREYPIGENVGLLGVRSRKVLCECLEASE